MNKADQNGSGATHRRQHDETYKRHAVELTLWDDRTVKAVAKELGVPAWALYEWRKLYGLRTGDRTRTIISRRGCYFRTRSNGHAVSSK